ncbi:MAG: metallopeptidase family protein [Pseudomonadota bacterium]
MKLQNASPTDFERVARATIASLPERFRQELESVVLVVEEFATTEQLAAVDIANKWNLTGLYEGVPLTEKSVWRGGDMPPTISLFRQPLLAELRETGVDFEELVRHVVIHEAGHHFGFSDDDMHALEDSAH